MKKITNSEAGYTLVELMIAFSIFSILMLVVYSTFFSQYKRLNDHIALTRMSVDAGRTLKEIEDMLDDYGSISVSGNQIRSSGIVIADLNSDGSMEGTVLNLDTSKGELLDDTGTVRSENIHSIQVMMGPATDGDVSVVNGVVLIVVKMEVRGITYTLKGGHNVIR